MQRSSRPNWPSKREVCNSTHYRPCIQRPYGRKKKAATSTAAGGASLSFSEVCVAVYPPPLEGSSAVPARSCHSSRCASSCCVPACHYRYEVCRPESGCHHRRALRPFSGSSTSGENLKRLRSSPQINSHLRLRRIWTFPKFAAVTKARTQPALKDALGQRHQALPLTLTFTTPKHQGFGSGCW